MYAVGPSLVTKFSPEMWFGVFPRKLNILKKGRERCKPGHDAPSVYFQWFSAVEILFKMLWKSQWEESNRTTRRADMPTGRGIPLAGRL